MDHMRSQRTESGTEAGKRMGHKAVRVQKLAAGVYPERSTATRSSLGLAASELLQIPELLQCRRVGQRIPVVNRSAMDDFAHRQLGNLATDRSGYVGDGNDLPGDVVGTRVLPDPALDRSGEVVSEAQAISQTDEENNPHVTLPLLPNDKALK